MTRDSRRRAAQCAEDGLELVSDGLTIDQVVDRIVTWAKTGRSIMKPPHVLPFERPAAELRRIDTLEPMVAENPELAAPLQRLQNTPRQEDQLIEDLTLGRVLVSPPSRPYTLDYAFPPLTTSPAARRPPLRHDGAIVGGLARLGEHNVMLIGTQEGSRHTAEHAPKRRHAETRGLPQALFDAPCGQLQAADRVLDRPGAYLAWAPSAVRRKRSPTALRRDGAERPGGLRGHR